MAFLPRAEIKRRLLTVLAAATIVWLSVMLVSGDSGALALQRAHAKAADLEAQVERYEAANAALEAEIQALENDPKAIERLAREELMMARPGETVIVIPDPQPAPPPSP